MSAAALTDLMPADLPRTGRAPDLEVAAPDGTALVWAGTSPRGAVWDVIVRPSDGQATEVVWLRPTDGGPSTYVCADDGPTTSRDACTHIRAALIAADIYRHQRKD